MKRSRFTEDQIIGVLKEHQAGIPTAELCRKHGISEATFYNWRSRYGGMEVSDARRLKSLEDENRRLKKLLAESMLDVATHSGRSSGRAQPDRRHAAASSTSLRSPRPRSVSLSRASEVMG